jgi:hypothetical protein
MTAKGLPIDSPTYAFAAPDGRSIDLATGLAYPAKAERARRNPKVGLLLEGAPGKPVVSIAAMAAVRDSNLQANSARYIAEIAAYLHVQSYGSPWSMTRNAVWYWTRILVMCVPKRILWWPSAADTDCAPKRWDAPSDTIYPPSDPAPSSPPSTAPSWPVRPWIERAKELLAQGIGSHLTLADDDGFPLPFRTRAATIADYGFELDVPAGAPWELRGSATLCFAGLTTFVGEVGRTDRGVRFVVQRTLPELPLVKDPREVFDPAPATRATLMERLQKELGRRGQAIPNIPVELPKPTSGSLVRAGMMMRMMEEMALRDKKLPADDTQPA